MALDVTPATDTQLDDFLALYGYTIPNADKTVLLARSLALLNTVQICQEGDTYVAQCFIAYAMSAEGGGLNPTALLESKTLTKKGLGRNAIVKEWDVNTELSGTNTIAILKRIPMAYAILEPLLCQNQTTSSSSNITNFDTVLTVTE